MLRTFLGRRFLVLAFAVCLGLAGRAAAAKEDSASGGYSVVVSKATLDDPQWKPVVDALVAKHGAR